MLGRENNQGSEHQNEEIPGKQRRLPLESLIIFPASEIGVQGNFIGTGINGTSPLPNGVNGIFVNLNFSGRASGDTMIGGPDPDAGNIIAFNAYNGVQVANSTVPNQLDGTIEKNTIFSNGINGILVATLNASDPHYRITRNSIYSNGRLGIDLAIYDGVRPNGDGVTPNDSLARIIQTSPNEEPPIDV